MSDLTHEHWMRGKLSVNLNTSTFSKKLSLPPLYLNTLLQWPYLNPWPAPPSRNFAVITLPLVSVFCCNNLILVHAVICQPLSLGTLLQLPYLSTVICHPHSLGTLLQLTYLSNLPSSQSWYFAVMTLPYSLARPQYRYFYAYSDLTLASFNIFLQIPYPAASHALYSCITTTPSCWPLVLGQHLSIDTFLHNLILPWPTSTSFCKYI
jgi:hypothetical protein